MFLDVYLLLFHDKMTYQSQSRYLFDIWAADGGDSVTDSDDPPRFNLHVIYPH